MGGSDIISSGSWGWEEVSEEVWQDVAVVLAGLALGGCLELHELSLQVLGQLHYRSLIPHSVAVVGG